MSAGGLPPMWPGGEGRTVDSLRTRDSVMLCSRRWQLHRLDRLGVDHLPFTLKVLLENLLRHEDGQVVTAEQVDLAAMRDALAGLGGDPQAVNPVIPAELVADHSVIADVFGRPGPQRRAGVCAQQRAVPLPQMGARPP